MAWLFENILVPADLKGNTEVAVKQALELACPDSATIHLVHVIKPKNIWNTIFNKVQAIIRQEDYDPMESRVIKLQYWMQSIQENFPKIKVNTSVRRGSVKRQIQDAAGEIRPQLIITCRNSRHKYLSFFPSICPNGLAKSTGFPVLAIMRKSVSTKIKIIVVPVSSFIPVRKIQFVTELAKKYRAAIHLVTIPDKMDSVETKENSFIETYRILKTGLTNPIEHHILKGNSLPKAILEYADHVNADWVLVNPGFETRISGFAGKHINDALPSSSELKILSIEPYHLLSNKLNKPT